MDGCVSSKINKDDENLTKKNGHSTDEPQNGDNGNLETEPELYFTPKVNLPIVIVKTMEDDEEALVEL